MNFLLQFFFIYQNKKKKSLWIDKKMDGFKKGDWEIKFIQHLYKKKEWWKNHDVKYSINFSQMIGLFSFN